MALSEPELIAKAQSGDGEAFCALVAMYQRAMYGFAFRLCSNHHDAEDLTQEVFILAHRAIGQFKGMSSLYTWLRKIMVNTFINQKRKRRPNDSGAFGDRPNLSTVGADRAAFNNVVMQQVMQRLDEVPPRSRLMFIMKHQEG